MTTHPPDSTQTEHPPGRRSFLGMVTTAGTVTGLAACAIPFARSIEPAENTASHPPVDVDISHLQPGQQMVANWQGRPVFIVRRTAAQLEALQNPNLAGELRDPSSSANQQPAYARNWHRSIVPEYGVYVGICTHLGCVPTYMPPQATGAEADGGYICPCHASHFDAAGRVFKGAPAPYNLPVPPYTQPSAQLVRLGQNPPGQHFDFASIEQI